jgi:hypothetical protein
MKTMDPVAMASYLLQAQGAQSQLLVATELVKEQIDASAQVVNLLDSGAQSGGATAGQYLNTYA